MDSEKPEKNIISGRVIDKSSREPVRNCEVILLHHKPPGGESKGGRRDYAEAEKTVADEEGRFHFRNVERGVTYGLQAWAFDTKLKEAASAKADEPVTIELDLEFGFKTKTPPDEEHPSNTVGRGVVGRRTQVTFEGKLPAKFDIWCEREAKVLPVPDEGAEITFLRSGKQRITVAATDSAANSGGKFAQLVLTQDFFVSEPDLTTIGGKLGVALERTAVHPTLDQALWVAIRNRTRAISFDPYNHFIDRVLRVQGAKGHGAKILDRQIDELDGFTHGVGTYQLLKTATQVFLLLECGVRIEDGRYEHHPLLDIQDESNRLDEEVNLDYIGRKLQAYLGNSTHLPYITRVAEPLLPELMKDGCCRDRVLTCRPNEPCLIELIWSYWHEEGMLVQTMNTINRRFQNVRAPGDRDPLAHLEIDPLRHVGNILWGQIQDELQLLPVKRRAYEYAHQYGLALFGKAAGPMRPADNRSKFLEAFHNLLHLTSNFYKEDNDTTVIADGFPMLNSLKEVHLLLAQGAHNQFGDLPWTARAEMMVQEWILARPEIREFLQSRHMVPYKEPWMPQVDTMKALQGWSDVTVTHFRDLGVYGEQILLAVRYGDWIDIADEESAKNWARYWRPEIQGYLHAYRAVTGVDLTNPDTVDSTVPAVHLRQRLAMQQQRMR